ncbi:MAG: hypothetical protein IT201_01570 [Thermoleophilia bacterium]|nr:hypothetical protein [Thermoleophilia bacterium]
MKRVKLAAVTTAIAALAVAAAVFATAGGAQEQTGEQTLTLIELEGADSFVDNPPLSEGLPFRVSPGDLGTVRMPLHDGAGVRQGTIHVTCIATRAGTIDRARFLCTGVLKLKDGTLTLSGVIQGQSDQRVGAITGGTGAYEGARGSITSELGPDGNRVHTVHLLP